MVRYANLAAPRFTSAPVLGGERDCEFGFCGGIFCNLHGFGDGFLRGHEFAHGGVVGGGEFMDALLRGKFLDVNFDALGREFVAELEFGAVGKLGYGLFVLQLGWNAAVGEFSDAAETVFVDLA